MRYIALILLLSACSSAKPSYRQVLQTCLNDYLSKGLGAHDTIALCREVYPRRRPNGKVR